MQPVSQFDEQRPAHTVTLDSYWIDRTEVTNAQFAAFLSENRNQNEGGEGLAGYVRGRQLH